MSRRMGGTGLAAVAALTACLALLPAAARPAAAAAADKLKPCQVDGVSEPALCGTYSVWENRATRSGRQIALNIVVLPALHQPAAADAFTFLEGGPGGGAAGDAPGFVGFTALRDHRDFLFVDQRGTGKSNPLQCDFYDAAKKDHAVELKRLAGELFAPAAVRRCRDELSKVADLKLYTTDLAMDDLDEVRAWLGYAKLDIEGGSYGTRAAQVYMRRHPGSVRAVVLDGVAPVDEPIPLHHAYAGQRAIDLVFAECAADAACHAAFPNLPAELKAVIQRVEHGVTVKVPDPKGGPDVEVTADRGTIAEGLRFMMYGTNARVVPLAVHRAYEGDMAQLVSLAIQRRAAINSFLAMGENFSVTCAEDIPYIEPAAAAKATANTMLGDYRVREQKAVCAIWPRGTIPADTHKLVHSDLPVLLFSGERDPVTPPEFGERVAKELPNGRLIIIPHEGHGAEGVCAQKVMEDFFERASVQGVDTACLMATKPPKFVLKQPVAIHVDDSILDTYAGAYNAQGQRMVISRRDGHLVATGAGPGDLELFPDAPNHFFVHGEDLEMEFVSPSPGAPPDLMIHVGNEVITAKRVP